MRWLRLGFRYFLFACIIATLFIDFDRLPQAPIWSRTIIVLLYFAGTIAVGETLWDIYKSEFERGRIRVSRLLNLTALFLIGSAAILRASVALSTVEIPFFVQPGPYTDRDVWLFVIDQALKGLAFDFMEVYGLQIGRLEHNPNFVTFTTLIFIFRAFFAAIIVGLFLGLFNTYRRRRQG